MTALSTNCLIDSESSTSRDSGAVNTSDSQGQVNVTAPPSSEGSGEELCWLQEDSVRSTTSKYDSHTSPHTGNMGTLLFCCFLSHVKAYTCRHTCGDSEHANSSVLRNISAGESGDREVAELC